MTTKEVEKILKSYKQYIAAIRNLEKMYQQKLSESETKSLAVKYSEKTKTNSVVSFVELYALELCEIQEKIDKLRNIIEMIDEALNSLNENEKKIIELKYKKGLAWWQIAFEMKYSERACRYIKNRALKKIKKVFDATI